MLFRLLKPAMFAFDPETGHRLAIRALSALPLRTPKPAPDGLAITVAGLTFPNPVGVAAGFDKDAEAPDALLGLGFGFTEVGSITPLPQAGNLKPRLFRLVEDKAVINRMGFNNAGGAAALERLRARAARPGIVGVNIGANKDSPDRIADYAVMARMMAPFSSYLCVNISSPNTPGLRALQDEAALTALIDAVIAARAEAACAAPPPIFLKVAPDLEPADIDAISRTAIDKQLGALVVSNTTISRPALRSHHADEAGGLSGEPLRDLALQRLRDFRKATGGAIPLVGVGGIASAQ
ncbi:MAG: dihydroorotate dehydrogenase (quinone), partial [Alphaproteobacteria bacterium HGW-Alphaproteobacteria-9]